MKVVIVGSRTFNDYDLLKASILALYNPFEINAIVSGGAKGADSLAERFAEEYSIDKIIFLPNWDKYGKAAGYRRNIDIIKCCDVCFAFWDGVSKGTKMDIDLCKTYNKPCHIIKFNNNPNEPELFQ